MKSIIVSLVLVLMYPLLTRAQELHPIMGKWKVVVVNNGVIVDFKNNRETVTRALSESLEGNPDSAAAIAVLTGMAKKYSDYFMVFRKDWIYQEIMNGEIRNELATYHLLEEEHTVYMRHASNIHNEEQSMNYDLRKDGILELAIYFMNKKMTLELERVDEDKKK